VTILLIIVAAILLCLAVALYRGDSTPSISDEISYSVLGMRLANGCGYSFPLVFASWLGRFGDFSLVNS